MKEFYQRHLPHWQPQGAAFFVTFRLKGSLPYEIIESLRREREQRRDVLHKLPESQREQQNTLDEQVHFEKWESYLDRAAFGPRWLSQPEIADVMKEELQFRDGRVFDLHAFSIMPNHVHVVFEPLRGSEWQSDTVRKSGYQPDLLSKSE